jgi:hypothetical protein
LKIFYTLKEAALLLALNQRVDVTDVIKQILNPDDDNPFLVPSVFLERDVQLLTSDGVRGTPMLPGLFTIVLTIQTPMESILNEKGINRQKSVWRDKDGLYPLNSQPHKGLYIALIQNGNAYVLPNDVRVTLRESELVISMENLEGYAKQRGIKLKPAQIQEIKYPVLNDVEVIPVRFIPYYTGGQLGPETTALFLAHKQGIDWHRMMADEDKLTAYHRVNGKTVPITRNEWESIIFSIKSLSERYHKQDKHFEEWNAAAIQILPVAFVLRNEFDAAYRRGLSSEKITFVDPLRGFERLTGEEDREARATNDHPYIPHNLRRVVFEGFPAEFLYSDSLPMSRNVEAVDSTEVIQQAASESVELSSDGQSTTDIENAVLPEIDHDRQREHTLASYRSSATSQEELSLSRILVSGRRRKKSDEDNERYHTELDAWVKKFKDARPGMTSEQLIKELDKTGVPRYTIGIAFIDGYHRAEDKKALEMRIKRIVDS